MFLSCVRHRDGALRCTPRVCFRVRRDVPDAHVCSFRPLVYDIRVKLVYAIVLRIYDDRSRAVHNLNVDFYPIRVCVY